MNKVIWLTGLSGSGKSTLAKNIYEEVRKRYECVIIDGDVLRSIQKNFDFSSNGRFVNVQLAIQLCKENEDKIVIVALMSPLREMRDIARRELGERFVEVYVQASLSECIKRDVKGLYKKALAGELDNFCGISFPYEEPFTPDFVINTEFFTLDRSKLALTTYLLGE